MQKNRGKPYKIEENNTIEENNKIEETIKWYLQFSSKNFLEENWRHQDIFIVQRWT